MTINKDQIVKCIMEEAGVTPPESIGDYQVEQGMGEKYYLNKLRSQMFYLKLCRIFGNKKEIEKCSLDTYLYAKAYADSLEQTKGEDAK